jgi:hypothetical protein
VPAYRSTPQLSEQQYIILKLQLPSWFQQVGFRLHHKIPCTLGAAQASEPTRQLRTIFCPWGRARTTVLCTCLVLQQSLQNFNDSAGTYLLGLMIDFRSAIPHTKLLLPSWFHQVGFLLHHKILCTLGAAQASEPTRRLRTLLYPWGRARTTVLCKCLVQQQRL